MDFFGNAWYCVIFKKSFLQEVQFIRILIISETLDIILMENVVNWRQLTKLCIGQNNQ